MTYLKILGVSACSLFLVAACGSSQNGESGRSTKTTSGTATLSTSAQPPISGAIFTTDPEGERVNQNIYAAKEDVYLNGGPAKEGAAGLPDGDYLFIVTDPGCKVALNDPLENEVITVEDGEFTELIQLFPFDDTPNNGGEYKVHVTPVEEYDPTARNSCFGFISAFSKTDNFKVREEGTFCVSGLKFFDQDYLGGPQSLPGDVPIEGFRINITNGITESTLTDENGEYSFCNLEDGATYTISETLPPENGVTWVQTFPAAPGTYTVTIDGADITGLDFGNSCMINNYWATSVAQCGTPTYPGAGVSRVK